MPRDVEAGRICPPPCLPSGRERHVYFGWREDEVMAQPLNRNSSALPAGCDRSRGGAVRWLPPPFDAIPIAVLLLDNRGGLVACNMMFARTWGISQSLLEGADDQTLLGAVLEPLENPAAFLARLSKAPEPLTPRGIGPLRFKDGRILEQSIEPYRADGRNAGQVWSFYDVTTLRKAEEQLRGRLGIEELVAQIAARFIQVTPQAMAAEAEATLRNLASHTGVERAFLLLLKEGTTQQGALFTSAAIGSSLNHFLDEFVPWAVSHRRRGVIILPCGQNASLAEMMLDRHALQGLMVLPLTLGDQVVGFLGLNNPGSATEWMGEHVRLLQLVGEIILNTLARHQAENALRDQESLLRTVVNSTPDWVFVKDRAHRYILANESFARSLALAPEDFLGKTDLDLGFPEEIVRGDTHAGIRGFWADDREVMETGRPKWIPEEPAVVQGRPVVLATYKAPVRDGSGHVMGVLGYVQDITERKQAEEALRKFATMQMLLQQSQKLESVGRLAAGIAHEINTPIQFVGDNLRFLENSFAELSGLLRRHGHLLEEMTKTGLLAGPVEEIRRAAHQAELDYLLNEVPRAVAESLEGVWRVTNIVRALKEFSHPGSGEKTAVNLNHALESTVAVCRNEWKYVAEVVLELEPSPPTVPCWPGELNQVFLNILINAGQAIAGHVDKNEKGRITVRTRADSEWFEIQIEDTGPGIPEAIQQRLFEPFFTTKPVGQGTGQGLAIARSVVVEKHGGTISFATRLNQGTTFTIRLPINP